MGAGLDKMRQMVEAGTNQRSTGSTDLGGGTHLKIPGPNVAGVVRTNLKYEDPMRSCGDEKIPGPDVAGVVRTNLKYEDPLARTPKFQTPGAPWAIKNIFYSLKFRCKTVSCPNFCPPPRLFFSA